jgi:nucleoside phosphorylase
MATAELLFVASEPRELAGLTRHATALADLAWPLDYARSGVLAGRLVLLVANGVGSRRAEMAVELAAQKRKIAAVVSVGYCGALSEELAIGDIFVGRQVEAGGRRTDLCVPQASRRCATGLLASVDRVAQSAAEKRALRAAGAAAVEMELAGIVAAASRFNLPVYCIRSVTDLCEESFCLDLNAALRSDGHFDLVALIRQAWRKPAEGFSELLRLHRRARLASRNLGEFLADCRF